MVVKKVLRFGQCIPDVHGTIQGGPKALYKCCWVGKERVDDLGRKKKPKTLMEKKQRSMSLMHAIKREAEKFL